MRKIGFSTGALARGDFRRALEMLKGHGVGVVELSALRVDELDPLIEAIPSLDLTPFSFISIHAPSRFSVDEEARILARLHTLAESGYPIVVHPDVIFTPRRWRALGDRLLIENMDKRKPIGRTVAEMSEVFAALPEARFCFDIGHARQIDPTMIEASLLLKAFGTRLAEVHMSEVNSASRHDPISKYAVQAFRPVMERVPEFIPIMLEPLIDQRQSDVETELRRASEAVDSVAEMAF